MNIKNKGSFYTPVAIAEWLTHRVKGNYELSKVIKVLEPSFGDGVFISSLNSVFGSSLFTLDAVELDRVAFDKVNSNKENNISLYHKDFLFWDAEVKYDLIIGNPPYIARKRLADEQADKCKEIHITNGLENKEVSNIWTSFLIKSASILSSNGVLAFVLPTELLQVNYAKEIRKYLLKNFDRLEIISFKSLAFQDIEQDTVILIAYRKPRLDFGLYFAEVSDVAQLSINNLTFLSHHGDHNAKWSSYMLTEEDMLFIENISKKCNKISDYCTSVAGIVTAANSFFIVNQKDVDKYGLRRFVKQIVQRGIFINGAVEISNSQFEELRVANKPCFILDLNDISECDFTDGLKEYLKLGVSQDIHNRYKCKLRKRWYDIPSIWKSEGMFFKRGHKYPKLVVNNADVFVTDSAYRIRMKDGYHIKSFSYSFYNSLTLLYSELNGRYYGGGVLEVTPNEFKSLPIPYSEISESEFTVFSMAFRNKTSIESLVAENDLKILSSIEGLTVNDIKRVQDIYRKVKQRRLRGN